MKALSLFLAILQSTMICTVLVLATKSLPYVGEAYLQFIKPTEGHVYKLLKRSLGALLFTTCREMRDAESHKKSPLQKGRFRGVFAIVLSGDTCVT